MGVISDLEQIVAAKTPHVVIEGLSKLKSHVRSRAVRRRLAPLLDDEFPDTTTAEVLVAFPDSAVVRLVSPERRAILKVAFGEQGAERLEQECNALDEFERWSELGSWRSHVARVLDRGEHPVGTWFTQTELGGQPGSKTDVPGTVLARGAAAAIAPVHAATSRSVAIDELLTDLVHGPVAALRRVRPELGWDTLEASLTSRLASEHSELVVARLHGDFSPSNVMWDEATAGITGIVDWSLRPVLQPPEIDLVHFALSMHALHERLEYGATVIKALSGEAGATDQKSIDDMVSIGPNGFSRDLMVEIVWLQHVSIGVEKADDLRNNPIWLHNNVDQVVAALTGSA